uniref:Putative ovule protein n=2 Tax=Solanum chacoense TaxID=4108 RepID=A0A0V0GUB2_SOLCH
MHNISQRLFCYEGARVRRLVQGINHKVSTTLPLLILHNMSNYRSSRLDSQTIGTSKVIQATEDASLSSLPTLNCKLYQLGKHTCTTFPHSVVSHAKYVFSLVHYDRSPSRVGSTLGICYFVSFIDVYPRCTWIFTLKDCFELFSII